MDDDLDWLEELEALDAQLNEKRENALVLARAVRAILDAPDGKIREAVYAVVPRQDLVDAVAKAERFAKESEEHK